MIVKASLSRLNPVELILFTRNVIARMTDNAHFATPTPALADVQTKLTEFETLTQLAVDGTREDRLNRDFCMKELKDIMRILSDYVSMTAAGDPRIVLSSGFRVRNQAEPTPPVTVPANFAAKRSSYSGMIELDWDTVEHAKTYQVMMTLTDPNDADADWRSVAVTSKSQATVNNLTPGTYYWFKVKAIGANSESPYSDLSNVMAA